MGTSTVPLKEVDSTREDTRGAALTAVAKVEVEVDRNWPRFLRGAAGGEAAGAVSTVSISHTAALMTCGVVRQGRG